MKTTLCEYISSLADAGKHPQAMRSDETTMPDPNSKRVHQTCVGLSGVRLSFFKGQHIANPFRSRRIEYGRRPGLNLGTRMWLRSSLMQCSGKTEWLLVGNDISLAAYGSPSCVTSQIRTDESDDGGIKSSTKALSTTGGALCRPPNRLWRDAPH